MTSHRAPAKHSEKSKATQTPDGEILGIQPWQKDSPRRRAVIVGTLAAVLVGSVVGTAAFFWPKSKPEVFDDLAHLDGQRIDCTYVLENYESDDFTDQMIAGGASALYRGSDEAEAKEYYYDHVDAVAVRECDAYYREHPGAPLHSEFQIHTSPELQADANGVPQIILELIPTGRSVQQS